MTIGALAGAALLWAAWWAFQHWSRLVDGVLSG